MNKIKFLINRSDAIGDTILTLPIAKTLKEHFPDSEIHFLVSRKCEDLFVNHKYVKTAHIFPEKSSKLKKLSWLKELFSKEAFTHYFHFGGSQLPNLMAMIQGVSFRGGLKSKPLSLISLKDGLRQSRRESTKHETIYNQELLNSLIGKVELSYDSGICVTKNEIDSFLGSFKSDKNKYIVIHPGMTGHTLNWPSKSYADFVTKTLENYGDRYEVIVSYTPSDQKYIDDLNGFLSTKAKSQIMYLNGIEIGLRGYMCLISSSSLFVGPSTGTTHLAGALNIPHIGIYSPIKVQAQARWAPIDLQDKGELFTPKVVCGQFVKCLGKSCPDYFCMDKVSVSSVFNKSKELLK